MLLSFVLPVFGVEDFIERCIRSLYTQNLDLDTFEVVVVNDGTNDKSIERVESLFDEFRNIRIIHQVNKGLASARNTGIIHSKGKYLVFVDPDDYLLENTVFTMLDFVETYQLDIAMFGQIHIDLKGTKKICSISEEFSDFHKPHILSGAELFKIRKSDSVCQYVFLRELIVKNNSYFLETVKYFEDAEWSARIFSYAKRCSLYNLLFYVYQLRLGSLTTSNSWSTEQSLKGYMEAASHLLQFKANSNLADVSNVNRTIIKFVTLPFQIMVRDKRFGEFYKISRFVRKSGFKKLDTEKVDGPRLLYARLYNISPFFLTLYFIFFNVRKSLKLRFG